MFTLRHRSHLVVVLVVLTTAWTFTDRLSSGQADEPEGFADPIKDRLETAKEVHRSRIDSIKKEVLATLERKMDDGRKKKGNKAIVDKLTVERDEFIKDMNNLPSSITKNREVIVKRIRSARTDLVKAYGQAIRDYTGAKKDVQADEIKAERETFLLKTAATIPYRREKEDAVEQPGPVPRRLLFDPNILVSSSWDFTIINQTTQKGAFKIVDCQIRHIDTDQPGGFAEFTEDGKLHLVFQNHRRISSGEAVVEKVANGQGRGVLDYNLGVGKFELVRR